MNQSKYIDAFIDDVNENMQAINRYLLALEQSSGNPFILNELFRAMHSLKASAQSMGFCRMGALSHEMENVVTAIQKGRIRPDVQLFDLLFRCLDYLEKSVQLICESGNECDQGYSEVLNEITALHEAQGGDGGDGEGDRQGRRTVSDFKCVQGILMESFYSGKRAFFVRAVISDDCPMKAVRAFLVIRALEKYGTVVYTMPDRGDIEEERFESEITAIVIENDAAADEGAPAMDVGLLEKVVGRVSDVSSHEVTELTPEMINQLFGPGALQAPPELPPEEYDPVYVVPDVTAEFPAVGSARAAGRQIDFHGRSVRIDAYLLDALQNLVSDLSFGVENMVRSLNKQNKGPLDESVQTLIHAATGIEDAVYVICTSPMSEVLSRLPLICADLSDELGKKVSFKLDVGDTRCDIGYASGLTQSLIHILRNSIDHGIERPEVRLASGKAEEGRISVSAYYRDGELVVETEDDGAGVDIQRVRAKAVKSGIAGEAEAGAMSRGELMQLLFLPSFTTRDQTSLYSGRGVGMDVVKAKTEEYGGSVGIESAEGRGTKLSIRIPRYSQRKEIPDDMLSVV